MAPSPQMRVSGNYLEQLTALCVYPYGYQALHGYQGRATMSLLVLILILILLFGGGGYYGYRSGWGYGGIGGLGGLLVVILVVWLIAGNHA
jgi:Protein of unknown function (DUF3309)